MLKVAIEPIKHRIIVEFRPGQDLPLVLGLLVSDGVTY
jgi:hypothetical protein